MIIGFLESCVQVGLIPSNTGYDILFHKSSINAKITDNENVICYSSENADIIGVEDMENMDKGMAVLNGNIRIHKKSIRGGKVYWADDVTAINAINDELCDTAEQLSGENIIINRENELKEEKARYEVQNRMYDELESELRHQIENIEEILNEIVSDKENSDLGEEDFVKAMKNVLVYGTFIKRKANLYMLAGQKKNIKILDLYLSVKENVEYLKLSGVSGNVYMAADGEIGARAAMLAYECFEYILESAMPDIRAVLVNSSNGREGRDTVADSVKSNNKESDSHGFKMSIVIASPTRVYDFGAIKQEIEDIGGSISIDEADGEVYIVFNLK